MGGSKWSLKHARHLALLSILEYMHTLDPCQKSLVFHLHVYLSFLQSIQFLARSLVFFFQVRKLETNSKRTLFSCVCLNVTIGLFKKSKMGLIQLNKTKASFIIWKSLNFFGYLSFLKCLFYSKRALVWKRKSLGEIIAILFQF